MIFASGAGSNANQIIKYFRGHKKINVVLVAGNNKNAGVVDIANKEGLPFLEFTKARFDATGYLDILEFYNIDMIILAGFMWKIPLPMIMHYKRRILNIHPALLPKFGGKGMFGQHVHEKVISECEKESGITIHFVDEIYDHGEIIFQANCTIASNETAETLAKKIQHLEHIHYPQVIEKVIREL